MKQTIIAKFEIDDDPDVSHLPDYQQSYTKYAAEVHATKVREFIAKEAFEFSYL